jgi:hypothetical protein
MAHTWSNRGEGLADRNDTTSHTLTSTEFGFTPTANTLLVFICSGSVTHDATGWTQQLAPVQFAELAVFTKTAAGGDNIVVTHNASNYPMDWMIFEFPEGSTYLDGAEEATGGTGDSRTWPTLSGLTSNAKTIIAAVCRSSSLATGTASIASWAITTNELRDLLTLQLLTSTDGVYAGYAYEEDVTATSVTPTATMTVGGAPFAGGAQYQMVVFAIEPASAEPEFTLEEATEANAATDLTLTHEPVVAIELATGSEVAVELSLAIEPFLVVEFGTESDVGQDIEIAVDIAGGFPPSIRRPVYYPRRKRNQVFT